MSRSGWFRIGPNVTPPSEENFALYEKQEATLDPAERNEVLSELYINTYKDAQLIFLHNSIEAALGRLNINWPISSTQGYTQAYMYRAQVLNT